MGREGQAERLWREEEGRMRKRGIKEKKGKSEEK